MPGEVAGAGNGGRLAEVARTGNGGRPAMAAEFQRKKW